MVRPFDAAKGTRHSRIASRIAAILLAIVADLRTGSMRWLRTSLSRLQCGTYLRAFALKTRIRSSLVWRSEHLVSRPISPLSSSRFEFHRLLPSSSAPLRPTLLAVQVHRFRYPAVRAALVLYHRPVPRQHACRRGSCLVDDDSLQCRESVSTQSQRFGEVCYATMNRREIACLRAELRRTRPIKRILLRPFEVPHRIKNVRCNGRNGD